MTGNKHDLIRERRLRQKLERVEAENRPRLTPSWFKYARCPLCRQRYVVNNNAEREVRPLRLLGVAICANCFYRAGTERLVRIYKVGKRLANSSTLDEDGVLHINTEPIGDIIREMKELFTRDS